MTERIVSPRLTDIVEAIEHIRSVLNGVPLEAFEDDWHKRWLVERGIEIISEASRHLPDDLKEKNSEIPWRKVAGIGNVIRHDYERIAPDGLDPTVVSPAAKWLNRSAAGPPCRARSARMGSHAPRSVGSGRADPWA